MTEKVTNFHRHRNKQQHVENSGVLKKLAEHLKEHPESTYADIATIELALEDMGWKIVSTSDRLNDGTAVVDYGVRKIVSNISNATLNLQFLQRVIEVLSKEQPVAPAQYRYDWVTAEAFIDVNNNVDFIMQLNISILSSADDLRAMITQGE